MKDDLSKTLTKEQKCAAKRLFDEGSNIDSRFCKWSENAVKYIHDAIDKSTTGGDLLNAIYFHQEGGCQSYNLPELEKEAFKALFQETDACTFCCGDYYCSPTLEGVEYFTEVLGNCASSD